MVWESFSGSADGPLLLLIQFHHLQESFYTGLKALIIVFVFFILLVSILCFFFLFFLQPGRIVFQRIDDAPGNFLLSILAVQVILFRRDSDKSGLDQHTGHSRGLQHPDTHATLPDVAVHPAHFYKFVLHHPCECGASFEILLGLEQ